MLEFEKCGEILGDAGKGWVKAWPESGVLTVVIE